ncbi:hypothetical protein Tco_0368477 [Tanacetum coccineum]
MSRDVIMVGSTMLISLLYRGEYSQWSERFMNYLEDPTDGEAMINSIKNDLWDALERQMRGSEYGEQDRKAAIFVVIRKIIQNQSDVNDALRYKKKAVVVTLDPLALVVEKTKVSKRREKVVLQSESEESDDEDISDLKKITALLAKAFNRKKYYVKPTNNNLRTSSASSSTNKKPDYVKSEDKKADEKKQYMRKVTCYNWKKEGHFAKDYKKAKVKDYNYYKTKILLAKKDGDGQVLLTKDQAWMESSSDSDKEISANMVIMAKMEKVLSDSEESSSSAEENIVEIVQIYLWIIDSGCRFGNNDFAVIVGYGDVVIGSMTIKKVYYVEDKPLYLSSYGLVCPMWRQKEALEVIISFLKNPSESSTSVQRFDTENERHKQKVSWKGGTELIVEAAKNYAYICKHYHCFLCA